MTKKVIAIISVLKPIDDTRNFEKIAVPLGNTNKYGINIIGFSTKVVPAHPNITAHPIFHFKRNSLQRLGASFSIWKILLKLKPELIIVNTTELLIVSIAYKIIFGAKIIYDLQENYYRNILYTDSYPVPVKWPLALSVRALEMALAPFISKFILAEKVYQEQMAFLPKSRAVVMENKALIPDFIHNIHPSKDPKLTFVYSGTIARHYGIFDAIQLTKALKIHGMEVELRIIGYAANNAVYRQLLDAIQNLDYITLIGGNSLVPHDQILTEMKKANFCLLPYQKNKSTSGRIPTKLYECLAMEKPMIITPNPAWNHLIEDNNAGILYDFKSDFQSTIPKLRMAFYGRQQADQYLWNPTSNKLLETVNEVIS